MIVFHALLSLVVQQRNWTKQMWRLDITDQSILILYVRPVNTLRYVVAQSSVTGKWTVSWPKSFKGSLVSFRSLPLGGLGRGGGGWNFRFDHICLYCHTSPPLRSEKCKSFGNGNLSVKSSIAFFFPIEENERDSGNVVSGYYLPYQVHFLK